MSMIKREMERINHRRAQVHDLLVDSGAIQECEVHEGTFIDQMDSGAVEEAREVGLGLIKTEEFDGNEDDLDEAIKTVFGRLRHGLLRL